MQIEAKEVEGALVVTPMIKRIGAANSLEFKDLALKEIDGKSEYVVMNLENVEFIDSSGIGALVSILKDLEREKAHFVICKACPGVSNLFKLTGLEKVFKLYPSVEGSLETFKTGG